MELQLRDPAHRVSPRAPYLWAAGAMFSVAFFVVVGLALTRFIDDFSIPTGIWIAYGALALGYLIAMPVLRFRTHRWETTDRAVYTQTGWLGRERRIAPMSRVQTVDFEQGALARALGLATVTVTTASAAGPLTIAGLDKMTAEQIVTDLTQRADLETDGT